jgi:signal peptidase II
MRFPSRWFGYTMVASLTAAVDLASKQVAFATIGLDGAVPLYGRFALMPVFNTGSAGGVMIGPWTWQINVLVTLAALVLITSVVHPLRAISPRATLALGLVAGGAIGNLLSMIAGPEGVADFLAVTLAGDTTIVMNVADLALWGGALLLLPVVTALVRAIRAERSERSAFAEA